MNPRPCSAEVAVLRARELVASPDNAKAAYFLGDGDYRPGWRTPWTNRHGIVAGDCRVAFLWCYMIPADRPGYNTGSWSTCSDCVAYNSLIEDAENAKDLVQLVTDAPREGDILAYPTVHVVENEHGVEVAHIAIGHGAIVVDVSKWDGKTYGSLGIMQVCGGAGRRPAAVLSSGAHFDVARPIAKWPKAAHRVKLLRSVP
jgi:hypothetical protein